MSERLGDHQGSAISLEEGLFVFAVWTLVWGPLVAVTFLQANKVLLLGTPLVVLTGLFGGSFKLAILRHRPLVIAVAAFFAGYFWFAYVEQTSEDFKSRAAAFEACVKIKTCVDRVQLEGFDIGLAGR